MTEPVPSEHSHGHENRCHSYQALRLTQKSMLRLSPALYIWPSLSYLDWIVEMKLPALVLAGGHAKPLVAPAADELFTHALVMFCSRPQGPVYDIRTPTTLEEGFWNCQNRVVGPAADKFFKHASVIISFQSPWTGLRHPNSNHFGGRVLELCRGSSSR